MLSFNVGDRVRWHREVPMPDDQEPFGIIREVFSDNQDTDELSLFIVEFGFVREKIEMIESGGTSR